MNILFGYSGHSYSVLDSLSSQGILVGGYVQQNMAKHNPFKLDYLGWEDDENFIGWKMDACFILGIGDNKTRVKLSRLVSSKNKQLLSVIDSSAILANNISLGKGIFISKGSIINSLTQIEDSVIINTGSIIEHNCIISEGAHIGPGAVLAGGVQIGRESFIGANSTLKQGIIIGEDSILGAGSVLLENIGNYQTWVGCPAKRIK